MKKCCKCKSLKPKESFHRNRDKIQTVCIACARDAAKAVRKTPLGALRHRWRGIIQRCLNHKYPRYFDWGGRGITVCDRWLSRENFVEDILSAIGPPPVGTSLDRINNDGNYEPGNMRWATPLEQCHNQRAHKIRKTNTSGVEGVTKRCGKWRARATVSGKRHDIGCFHSLEEARDARVKFINEFKETK